MKWFFRFWSLIIFISVIAIWGYISLAWAKDTSLIVRSPLQGVRILHPGEWQLFPERIIPGYVKTEVIPKSLNITGTVDIQLPYYQLLSDIQSFHIKASYTLEYPLNSEDIDNFTENGSQNLILLWKAKIEGILQSEIQNHIQNNNFFTVDKMKQELLKKTPEIQGLNIQFIEYPNMEEYQTLKNQVISVIKKEQVAAKSATRQLEEIAEQQRLNNRKAKLESSLDFSIKQSQAIENAQTDIQTTFSVLGYLLDHPFNTPSKSSSDTLESKIETQEKK